MAETAAMTAADIARLARVTRGTVSNWRRRYVDFPAPCGGTDASPAYDRAAVEAWLAGRGVLPQLSPDDRLWRAVADGASYEPLDEVVTRTAWLLVDRPDEREGATKSVQGAAGIGANDEEIRQAVTAALAVQDSATTLDALLDRYAETAGIPATPGRVAGLMADLAEAYRGGVFDPAAGTGELLVAALDRAATDALGQELDGGLARLAELRLHCGYSVAEREGLEVAIGDSLRDDKFSGLCVQSVLCHPPFGDRDWGHEELAHDPRWEYGIPPKSEPELAWVQHAIAHLEPGGRAVMLLPPAVASRASGRRIRGELLRRGALRAIIALPVGAVRPRHVPVHLWVLERPVGHGPADPRVLLVEGSAFVSNAETGAQDAWTQFDEMVIGAWQSYTGKGSADEEEQGPGRRAVSIEEDPGHWRIVRAIDLLDEMVDLEPARHVAPAEAAVPPSRILDEVRVLSRHLRAALATAADDLPPDDWASDDRRRTWRTVTVAELVRSGMAEYYPGSGKPERISVRDGDVLVPAGAAGPIRTVVVGVALAAQRDTLLDRHVHLIRPDTDVLDPWFLAGFLAAPANVKQASYGTAAIRVDARRLTVPLVPLEQQRLYGTIFRRLRELDAAIAEVATLAGNLTGMLARSLADGTLVPPGDGDVTEGTSE
jgi:hypothetical protein